MAASTASMCLTRLGFCVYSVNREKAAARFMNISRSNRGEPPGLSRRNKPAGSPSSEPTSNQLQQFTGRLLDRHAFAGETIRNESIHDQLPEMVKDHRDNRQGVILLKISVKENERDRQGLL